MPIQQLRVVTCINVDPFPKFGENPGVGLTLPNLIERCKDGWTNTVSYVAFMEVKVNANDTV